MSNRGKTIVASAQTNQHKGLPVTRHMNSQIGKGILIVTTTALLGGCVTFGGGKNTAGSELRDSSGRTPTVVTQPGLEQPVVSPFDRDKWLQVRNSNSSEVNRMYAMLATGEGEAAMQAARAFLAKNPGNVDGLSVLAAGLVLARNYQLAGYYAGRIEAIQPGSAEALNIRGLGIMLAPNNRHADFVRAIDFFQRAHDAGGNQIAAGLNLGHLQLELGNAAAALAAFQTVVERCGSCSAGLMGQGIAAGRTGNYQLASDSFRSVIRANSRHTEARFHLALVTRNGYNDKKGAEDILQKLLADPNLDKDSDRYVKERASAVLRRMRGELDESERMLAQSEGKKSDVAPVATKATSSGDEVADREAAEAMLTSGSPEVDGEGSAE